MREKQFHFISGLPRSGSTLLSAILRQNSRFHASIVSPLPQICKNIISQVSIGGEWETVVTAKQRKSMLRGIFASYYEDIDNEVIFDTNRAWSAALPLVRDLHPSAKVIVCVRNVAWILDSLERLYRVNPYENTRLFLNDGERATVYSRVEALAQRSRLVGSAWAALRDAYFGEYSDLLLIVDYESFTQFPEQALKRIYEFIEQPYFEHDLNNLAFDSPLFDKALGLPGLHRVRSKLETVNRATTLPPDLFKNYSGWSFWQNSTGTKAQFLNVGNQTVGKRAVSH